MNDIERFLDRACCGVGGSSELRRHLRDELREHLDEEIERNVAAGMARDEAVQKAIEEFGDPVVIRDGLQTVHGRRLMTLLIEKSMLWKVRTMKTEWKWSFVAHVALILTIAAEVYFAAAAMTYIVPGVRHWHDQLGTPPLVWIETTIKVASVLLYDFLWIPCLLLPLVGWIAFEKKYRRENKSLVRLTALSVVSLVLFLVMAMVCVPMTIDLAILPGQIYDLQVNLTPQQAERIVLPRIVEAEAAFTELDAAVGREDWPAADRAATQLADAYRSLGDVSNGALVLAGENQRGNLDDIRYLIHDIRESSRDIHSRFIIHTRSAPKAQDGASLKLKVQTHFGRLGQSYRELRTKSDLFAAARASDTLE